MNIGSQGDDGFVPTRPQPRYFIDPDDLDDVGISQAIFNRRAAGQPGAVPAATPGVAQPAGRPAVPAQAQPTRPAAPAQAQPVPSAPVGDTRPNDPVDESDGLLPAPLRQQAQQRQSQQVQSVVGAPTKDESPIGRMQLAAASPVLSTPRPTDKNAAPGAHHGWRKAGDIAAGIGMGILTHNPAAGMKLYDEMSSAPLRKQQSAFDAQHATSEDTYLKAKELAAAETNEDKVAGMKAQYEARAGKAEAETENLKQKFNPDTYQEDPSSPTGWTAERYGTPGKREQAEPPAALKASVKEPPMPKTYEELVIRAKQETNPTKKAAYEAAANEIRETEIKKFQGPNRAPTDLETWQAAFRKEWHRDPTAEEIAQRHARQTSTYKDQDAVEKHFTGKGGEYDRQEQEYQKRRKEILHRYGADTDPKSNYADAEPEIQQLDRWNEGEKAKIADSKVGAQDRLNEERARQSGPGDQSVTPNNQSGFHLKAFTKSGITRKIGDKVRLKNGGEGTITGFNEKGQFSYE